MIPQPATRWPKFGLEVPYPRVRDRIYLRSLKEALRAELERRNVACLGFGPTACMISVRDTQSGSWLNYMTADDKCRFYIVTTDAYWTEAAENT